MDFILTMDPIGGYFLVVTLAALVSNVVWVVFSYFGWVGKDVKKVVE